MAFSDDQRHSKRVNRHFLVTDHEDDAFADAFVGQDVNLTGLSFWLDDADWFLPGQQISLRIKNLDNNEVYCLDAVEVVHLQQREHKTLCGCHITQVSSDQLLAHHRTVVASSSLSDFADLPETLSDEGCYQDFDFDEEGAAVSGSITDLQSLVMINLLQSRQWLKESQNVRQQIQTFLQDSQAPEFEQANTVAATQIVQQFDCLIQQQATWGLFAKLIAYTPESKADRQAWQTMIADFETVHLNECQRLAFDFMHQGMSATKALGLAKDYVQNQLDVDTEAPTSQGVGYDLSGK